MAAKTVLVSGANGRTGRPVIAALAKRGLAVRAFIRNADQEAQLKSIGASGCAIGDMADRDSIARALEGCQGLVHIGPPMHADEVKMTGNFVDCAKEAGVEHFVYYSVMHPLRREVRHHSLKLDAEETVIECGLPYTIVQPIRYMQHLEPIWTKVKDEGVHAMPFNTAVKFNVVDLMDLADVTARILLASEHYYATYELAGPEALSQEEMARILSEELGRTVEARTISLEQLEKNGRQKGLSDDRIEQMRIMNEHYDRFGFFGNPNVLKWVLGREPTTYRSYVRRLIANESA